MSITPLETLLKEIENYLQMQAKTRVIQISYEKKLISLIKDARQVMK